MSIRYYDDALLTKIQKWVGDDRIKVSGTDDKNSVWMRVADETGKDKITLPLVSLSRSADITIKDLSKRPMTFDGFKYKADDKKIEQLNGIGINIPYQLDIYTRHRKENDDLMREFVFKFINNPTVEIEIVYKNTKISHISNVFLTDTITDNSDIPEHLINGEFFRCSLGLYIPDAYLFDYRIRDTLKIELEYDDDSDYITYLSQDRPEKIIFKDGIKETE